MNHSAKRTLLPEMLSPGMFAIGDIEGHDIEGRTRHRGHRGTGRIRGNVKEDENGIGIGMQEV